jgi:hypothetical protein
LQVGGGGIFSNGPLSLFAPATTTTFASSNSLLSISHATGTFSGTGILLDFATSTYNTASPGTFKIPEDEPIYNSMITRSLEKAQTRIEELNFDNRKHVLAYDDVLNIHRQQRT